MSHRMGTSPRFLSACFVTTSIFLRSAMPFRMVRSIGFGVRFTVTISRIIFSFHCFQFFASVGDSFCIWVPIFVSVSLTSRERKRRKSGWNAYLWQIHSISRAAAEIFLGLIPIVGLNWWRGAVVLCLLCLDLGCRGFFSFDVGEESLALHRWRECALCCVSHVVAFDCIFEKGKGFLLSFWDYCTGCLVGVLGVRRIVAYGVGLVRGVLCL